MNDPRSLKFGASMSDLNILEPKIALEQKKNKTASQSHGVQFARCYHYQFQGCRGYGCPCRVDSDFAHTADISMHMDM